jgi:hypothetical protein
MKSIPPTRHFVAQNANCFTTKYYFVTKTLHLHWSGILAQTFQFQSVSILCELEGVFYVSGWVVVNVAPTKLIALSGKPEQRSCPLLVTPQTPIITGNDDGVLNLGRRDGSLHRSSQFDPKFRDDFDNKTLSINPTPVGRPSRARSNEAELHTRL